MFVAQMERTLYSRCGNISPHNLYSSLGIIMQMKSRRMRWAGHVARMGEERKVCKVLLGKPRGKRPLGSPRNRWDQTGSWDIFLEGGGGFSWLRIGASDGLLCMR
jgi:hypothetical protein